MDWATTLTAAGALLGGLALPIAFIQLGAQRRDVLRAQVDKVGAWHEHLEQFEQRQLSVIEGSPAGPVGGWAGAEGLDGR